jgi:hypothetical protein
MYPDAQPKSESMRGVRNPSPQPAHSGAPSANASDVSLAMSTIGAAVGAGIGALVWFAFAYVTGCEIGFLAAFVGAMAGWGAVWFGKVQNETVGLIAAVMGLVGIFAGSYAGYHHGFHRELEKAQLTQEFFYEQQLANPQWDSMSAQDKQAAFDRAFAERERESPGYFAALISEPIGFVITLIFGGLGVYYGFRKGSGIASQNIS